MQPTPPPGGQPAPAAADAVLYVVRNIGACQFVWEDRASTNMKAVRVAVGGWPVVIDVHPCRMGTVTTAQGFFMGGAYIRGGGEGNACNLDELAEANRDALGLDLRDVLIQHLAPLFPGQIAAMIANKDKKSRAEKDTNWRRRDDQPKPPPGSEAGRKPWNRDQT
jgi:hypothetical protein